MSAQEHRTRSFQNYAGPSFPASLHRCRELPWKAYIGGGVGNRHSSCLRSTAEKWRKKKPTNHTKNARKSGIQMGEIKNPLPPRYSFCSLFSGRDGHLLFMLPRSSMADAVVIRKIGVQWLMQHEP